MIGCKYRDPVVESMDRRLGPTEVIYYLLDQLHCLNFVVYAEISGKLDPARLDLALQIVQSEKPLLRASIVTHQGHPWFKPVPMKQAPLKVQTAPYRNWRQKITEQLESPFTGGGLLCRFFWFGGSGEKTVVAMVFHHAIADGKSGVNALMEVIQRASGTEVPLRFQPAHPSAQALDRVEHQGLVHSSVRKFKYWLGQGKAALLFPKQLPGYDVQLRSQRQIAVIPVSVPAKTAQALLAECRANGTTVHGALGAAQLLAINEEFGDARARQLGLTSLADLRGVLSGDLTDQDLGLYIATITTVHAVPAQPDFWQLATHIRKQLQESTRSGDANLVHSVYPKEAIFSPSLHMARLVQSAAAMAPASSMLTNIGKVDVVALDNGVQIRSAGFVVAPPPQNPICVTATSYADGMHLNVLYDQTKLDDEQAHRIAHNLVAYLNAAAGATRVPQTAQDVAWIG